MLGVKIILIHYMQLYKLLKWGLIQSLFILEKIEDIQHNVSLSDRSKSPVEPLVSEQWFVRMSELAGPAIKAVETGRLKFHPERWSKTYLGWLENVQDWCISRQLWWGHRIPVRCGTTRGG